MNRKILFLLAVLLLLGGIGIYFLRRPENNGGGSTAVIITPPPLNPSGFPAPISENQIAYSAPEIEVFPSVIPYFSIKSKQFDTEWPRILAALSLPRPTSIISGSRGRYVISTAGDTTATISETPLSLSVSSPSLGGGAVNSTVGDRSGVALAFLRSLSLIPEAYEVTASTEHYFSRDKYDPVEQLTSEGAAVIQTDFVVRVGGFRVYTNDADMPLFSASFDAGGLLTRATGVMLPELTTSTQQLSVVPYKTALTRLMANEGVLSSIGSGETVSRKFLTGAVPSTITITGADLGYYSSPNQPYLVPVYVFFGTAQEPNTGTPMTTTTVVSAL